MGRDSKTICCAVLSELKNDYWGYTQSALLFNVVFFKKFKRANTCFCSGPAKTAIRGRGRNLGPKREKDGAKMYSSEERIRAVKLYEKYGKRAAAVIRELGYPDRNVLTKWYQEYIHEGALKEKITRKPKYTEEQRGRRRRVLSEPR